jgi:uncharacterized protein YfaP (DUF2135 family)
MKKLIYLPFVAILSVFTLISCGDDDEDDPVTTPADENEFVGQDGNPRFNLQFNNEDNVDLDLYVKTPDGNTLFYGNRSVEGGELDVDCLCSSCPQGPNENIFWEDGTAPSGEFEYWVQYYSNCGSSGASSDFELRVIRNGSVLVNRTGTLSEGSSTVWTHAQP